MNRVIRMAREGKMVWFHCVSMAVFASWMKPSLHDHGKTRYREGFGRCFNLSEAVMLPFGLPMVVRKRMSDENGRGGLSMYLDHHPCL
jgi:hypothetical protein